MKKSLFLTIIVLFACCREKQNICSDGIVTDLPSVVIYKTTKDYSNNIPIVMNDNKSKIISYPAVVDVSIRKKPLKLCNSYWLDNFGIQKNTVYTSYTYDEYMSLSSTPSTQVLLQKIIDKNPFVEMYTKKFVSKSIDTLNKEIGNGFQTWMKVK